MAPKPWIQPELPDMPPHDLIVLRLEVVIDQQHGTTFWALFARSAATQTPLAGVVTPHVQRDRRHDVENDYVRDWRLWLDDFMPPF